MTIYNIYTKRTNDKRFRCSTTLAVKTSEGYIHGTHDPKVADRIANRYAMHPVYKAVKIVAVDDNGIKNELIYK